MKRFLLGFTVLLFGLALFSCDHSREFPVDGEFVAYKVSTDRNAPVVTMVSVTILDDKIVGYKIDCRQGVRDGEEGSYTFSWNEKTKQELGFEYKMHWRDYAATDDTPTLAEYEGWLEDNNELEWFEQVNLVAAHWLAHGVNSLEVDGIDAVAGVTVDDEDFVLLAKEAVQLAKAGKLQAIVCSGVDLYSASMKVSSAKVVSELKIDTLQSDASAAEGTFAWNPKTKQELGYEYKMHWRTYAATDETPTLAEYEGWLEDNDELEWFQQVALITDYVMANGWNNNLQPLTENGKSGSLDGVTAIDTLASVSITTGTYYQVLKALFDKLT